MSNSCWYFWFFWLTQITEWSQNFLATGSGSSDPWPACGATSTQPSTAKKEEEERSRIAMQNVRNAGLGVDHQIVIGE